MLNKVLLIGRLGVDPKRWNGRNPATTFSLATHRFWRDAQGGRQQAIEWHHLVFWGRLGELAAKLLRKGTLVWIEGRLRTNSWADRESDTVIARTEVVAERFQVLAPPATPPGSGEAA